MKDEKIDASQFNVGIAMKTLSLVSRAFAVSSYSTNVSFCSGLTQP